jgi:hypothetical protein
MASLSRKSMEENHMFHARRALVVSRLGLAVAATLVAGPGCDEVDTFTPEEWAVIEKLEPLKGGKPPALYNDLGDDEAVA